MNKSNAAKTRNNGWYCWCSIVRCHCRLCIGNTCQSVVVFGIVGLAWIGLALYNTLKLNTKLQKVEDIKQPNSSVSFESNIKKKHI